MTEHLRKRFVELDAQANAVVATRRTIRGEYSGDTYEEVDADLLLSWCVKARHLLVTACGRDSEHLKSFIEAEEAQSYEENLAKLRRVHAVFLAAKEDFEGGYLTSVRNLVQAEVFSTELEQAQELLTSGYITAAAVISGVVLETGLRNLCHAQGLPVGKLDKMNADLAKAGQYNTLIQKRVTALAAIRNSAAHGNVGEFDAADVKAMIEDTSRLLGDWLA